MKILSKGIIIRTCEPPFRYTQDNINELSVGCPLAIYWMMAHAESKQKSDWVKDAIRRKRQKAAETGQPHGLRCPAWLRPVGHPHPDDPSRLVVEEWQVIDERKVVIRYIHELCWEGNGFVSIIHNLESKDIKSWGRSGRWTHSSVAYHLTTRATIGESVPNCRLYKGNPSQAIRLVNYPPILSLEEYERTQDCLRKRRGKGGRKSETNFNLFTHLLQDRDGRPLALRSSKRPDGERYLYLSPSNMEYAIPYELFADHIISALRKPTVDQIDGSERRDEWTAKIEEKQAVVSSKQLAYDSLARQIKELPEDRWPVKVVARMADLEEEIKQGELALRELKEQGNTSTRAEAFVESQSIIDYVDSIKDASEKKEVLERLKKRLPLYVKSITVAVEKGPGHAKWVHVRVEYHGGFVQRYAIRIGNPNRPSKELCGEW
jgi:hypothetical protein